MLTALAVANYRSLRHLVLPLGALNVVTGANGVGKSSVYRALRLLAETSQGRGVQALAREGGFASTLWAGPESISRAVKSGHHPVQGTKRNGPVNLRLGFAGDEPGYLIDFGLSGLPDPEASAFAGDPAIKREAIWNGPVYRPASALVERAGPAVRVRARDGSWNIVAHALAPFDSLMTQVADPTSAPDVLLLREQIRSWRFYDQFRTDAEAPARTPQVGTYTPVLSHDGADVAAAFQTILEIGDARALTTAVADAFPRSSVSVDHAAGRFGLHVHQHGLLRPLDAAELSDGTLRYLLWIAALLTPRPPQLLVLNEPETSLHPDLLPPLARLIAVAAASTQIIVVSHSERLMASLAEHSECNALRLEKELGETKLAGVGEFDHPAWTWPPR